MDSKNNKLFDYLQTFKIFRQWLYHINYSDDTDSLQSFIDNILRNKSKQ
jgi:hypothetical protein